MEKVNIINKIKNWIITNDAQLAGLLQVLIIHGKGTGALRQGVHEYLRHHYSVEKFTLADMDEGGAGATLVILK